LHKKQDDRLQKILKINTLLKRVSFVYNHFMIPSSIDQYIEAIESQKNL
jgi:hypothetical protein